MKTVDLTGKSIGLDDVLTMAADENVIVRTSDGREFVVAEIDDFDREVELVRQDAELLSFLEARSKSPGAKSLAEVKKSLGLG